MHDLQTTLVAVATARGPGALGCVRLSGPRAHEIAASLTRGGARAEADPSDAPRFVTFTDAAGGPVDHGYLVAFRPSRSYTAEPAAELWTHGSPPVLEALVDAAVRRGAVPAGPGEFTYRALVRGRIDLTRAEAVADLIAARTLHQARVAFEQVEGALARRLAPLREVLVDLVARGEAALEFVEESEVHLPAGRLARGIAEAERIAAALVEEGRRGRVLREGARVALTGATSVGKSSLFNRLLARDRAIVSGIPGTTRDTLEETVDWDGVAVTLVDTAGLRVPADPIEAEGVDRARRAAREADLAVVVLDASRPPRRDEAEAAADALARGGLVAANKIDLVPSGAPPPVPGALPVSARDGRGIAALATAIRRALGASPAAETPAVTNVRHARALEVAAADLGRAGEALAAGLSEEAALEDLRHALAEVGTITGEVGTDDLYDRIFSTFCIGK